MTELIWDAIGDRGFETGIDHGVLYPHGSPGVAWNGLVSVDEKPVGGDSSAFYANGKKYINLANPEYFAGTIEAYTYPIEFEQCEGSAEVYAGFNVTQQNRHSFDFSYRTLKGNDIDADLGYKLHIIYNCLASVTDKNYSSTNESVDPTAFSWDFTTTPVDITNFAPTSHVILDSTRVDPLILKIIETKLYGSSVDWAKALTFDQLVSIFASTPGVFKVESNPATGISELVSNVNGDLMEDPDKPAGIYSLVQGTTLIPTSVPGINVLESS